MLRTRIFRLIRDQRLSVPILRGFHHEFTKPEPQPSKVKNELTDKQQNLSSSFVAGGVQDKYKVFRDEEATEIFDVEEARYRERELEVDTAEDQYMGLNLKRGVHGVFDVEDLVELLRKENVDDIFVCYVPEELKYVDHLVVCSARSYRHMLATAGFVRRMFKIKRSKGDLLPRIEGEKSHDWMAMDLGNIALHIFSPKAREEYDLESLWAIGSQYDTESQKPQQPLGNIFMAPLPKSET
ncbi:mitochondrial assembly of ribosomal large subunit protein 1 [Drosophila sulfurigaster albostrigata]|uniref:mitochondrial assembly of ribosomal large subunit protein 1 n=1 Tax=Drosophila sulfurigaster albostrigata TaxID=89887 RepID=UPI002D21A1B5|nr:mitochondrial assembly of ribosomal large subunit protein 1 [Drosophila sulfurigaster albostrigata]